ncbi:transcriptional regulator [Arsenophonus sp. ENCA]|uniref:helix-turn-helix domain-containing protein n=1 Tax=Arsenophonus sp. ENCA TaxID=1987579 RepID=UPI000BDD0125|nr:helix-turn-helix transcriptional regulator [Arsenophonus sp. ENCA]PAV01213.1 transcriptional regulator [Arsenophonus sp. ENCA]
MNLGKKIKLLRMYEGLTQKEFCELIDLPINTLKKYEGGHFEPGGNALANIVKHPRFDKYLMWLMTNRTNEKIGQISPILSPGGLEITTSGHSDQKTG